MSRKQIIRSIVIVGIIALSIYGIGQMIRLYQKDACIDKGGRWNDELNECETEDKVLTESITNFYWYTAADTVLNREYLIRGSLIESIAHSPIALIEALNKREATCKIEYIDLRGDTLWIRILNDEVLSEQMGSTGAYCYLGETVYTLTEHDSIKWVNIEMGIGSHASPGVYVRLNFMELEKR